MTTSPEQLRARTKDFALWIIRLYRTLPNSSEAQVIVKQLLRCATSVGANYRAACRSRSRAEFAAKIGIVVEEADESMYWMELLVDGGMIKAEKLESLRQEANELTSVFIASRQSARGK
jgi:four helix bundle protein